MVITDFGLSTTLNKLNSRMYTLCGTLIYAPPEINVAQSKFQSNTIIPKSYTSKVDIWSFGILIYMMLVNFHPFDPFGNLLDVDIWNRIQKGQFNYHSKEWTNVSYGAKNLINNLLVVNPDKRFSIDQIINHPWFFDKFSLDKKLKKTQSSPVFHK